MSTTKSVKYGEFAELVRTGMARKPVGTVELARRLGVRDNTVSSWRTGVYAPDPRDTETITRLAEALGIPEQKLKRAILPPGPLTRIAENEESRGNPRLKWQLDRLTQLGVEFEILPGFGGINPETISPSQVAHLERLLEILITQITTGSTNITE